MSLPTVGVIARQLGQPVHKITYVIKTRGIRPIGRAGVARVYDEAAVRMIAEEIRRIDARLADGALAR